MKLTRTYWPAWKNTLQNSGFSNFAAVLLESLAPIGFMFSQIMYMARWVFPTGQGNWSLSGISTLLEDSDEVRLFARYLMESENDLS